MRPTSLFLPGVAFALLTAAVFAVTTIAQSPAQSPQAAPNAAGEAQPRTYPAPTNLKVLPKEMTGQQVHDLMEKWQGSLGVHCSTCHTSDPNDIGPDGRPRLKFADDSRPEKNSARIMYTMMQDINKTYISKIDAEGGPVTCGTCHRGHLDPEEFVIPAHEGPRAPQGAPQGATTPAKPK